MYSSSSSSRRRRRRRLENIPCSALPPGARTPDTLKRPRWPRRRGDSPPPLRRVARLLPPQLGRRWSGGGVCPRDFLGSGGKRADSSDAGLAGFASFYCILLLIKKLRVHRRPSPLSSWLSPPPLPLASDLPNPAPPKPLSGPAAPLGPPRPPPPPLRPHPTALASGFAAQKQQRQRRQLRAQPLPRPAGGTRTRRPRSRAELRGAARGALGRWRPGSRPNARRPAPRLPRAGPRSPASAVLALKFGGAATEGQGWRRPGVGAQGPGGDGENCPVEHVWDSRMNWKQTEEVTSQRPFKYRGSARLRDLGCLQSQPEPERDPGQPRGLCCSEGVRAAPLPFVVQ
ncbi:translation initiation factor IF-2-like [Cervus canadensis]|uniref:translation initiation factor IF-2-like n=1 Tax=Cervus canadensis TaxID=1574408 RepID=UPI001C9E486F|nr:translation initiation factor IF-2-like [Cervus canadensis]